MSNVYKLSKLAELDIERIAQYIWHDNPVSAIEFIDEVERICGLLSRMPGMGNRVEFIKTNEYFFFPAGKFKKFLIFYQTENQVLEIIRVLHVRQDIENLFDDH